MIHSRAITYKHKKIITLLFLLLTIIAPIIGVVGVILMWIWMDWSKWIKVVITLPYVFVFVLSPMILLGYLFVFRPAQIMGEAMAPNYVEGQFYMTRVLNADGDIERGDVIVFTSPRNQDVDYVQRVVALPYERIVIQNGQVLINGEKLNESQYLESSAVTQAASEGFLEEGKEYTVPADSYFVLGDNRTKSGDSRYLGPIKREAIKAKVAFCYWNCVK